MKRPILISMLICLMGGCATADNPDHPLTKGQLMQAYLTDVSKSDGINREEAILLAKSQFIFRGHDRDYNLNRPKVVFEDNLYWAVKFDPISKTIQELINEPDVYIIIAKDDGSVSWREENPQWQNK